jgi:aspartate aminotransferase
VSGISELKKLAAEWMNNAYACYFQEEHCLVVNGGKLGIYLLLQYILQKEDEVIIASPYWVSYPTITKLFGGCPIVIDTNEEDRWKITPTSLKKACSIKSRILILNNACNPTGALYTKSELKALLNVAREQDLLVISDEVYSELIYDNKRFVSCGEFSEYQDRVVIIQSCSKNFSMTGWRVGFVFAPPILIKQLTSLISQSTSGVATISQWAAVAALRQAETVNSWVRENMRNRRNVLIKAIHDYFGITLTAPPASLYVFSALHHFGVKNITSTEFCKQALEVVNVALVPGIAFGKEGFIRFSFGASEQDLELGVKTLADFCKREF